MFTTASFVSLPHPIYPFSSSYLAKMSSSNNQHNNNHDDLIEDNEQLDPEIEIDGDEFDTGNIEIEERIEIGEDEGEPMDDDDEG